MSSLRYTIKDRLDRANEAIDRAMKYYKENLAIFTTYGDRYGNYSEYIKSLMEMAQSLKDLTQKLNDVI